MMVNCPICGKLTCIHWPEHWVYRRGSTYYCSANCLDISIIRDTKLLNEIGKRRRKELINMSDTRRYLKPNERAAALRIYEEKGKDAAIIYLRRIEIPNPEKCLKNLLQRFKGINQAETATVKVDGPIRIETKEPEKIEVIEPENPTRVIRKMFGFEVSAIRDDVIGEFYYDIKFNRIDWRSPDGTEVSLSPTAWKVFSEKIPTVLNALGVKL